LRASLLGIGLWRDEAYTYFDASAPDLGELFHRLMLGETHPPLYFLIEFAWGRIAGWSDEALKIPAYIFGVALIPGTYLLARTAGGRLCATIAAALVAFDARQIYYSADARPYSLAALEIVAAIWLFSLLLRRRTFVNAAALLTVGTLLAYTQYSGATFLVGMLLYSLAFLRGRIRLVAFVVVGSIGAAFLPWSKSAFAQFDIAAPWRTWIPLADRPVVALQLLGGTLPVARASGIGELCAGAFLAVTLLILWRRTFANPSIGVSALGLLLGAAFEAAFSSQDARYMVALAPLTPVLTAWLFTEGASALRGTTSLEIRQRATLWVTVAILVAAVVLDGMHFTREIAGRSKSGMRDLVARSAADTRQTLFLCAPDYSAATLDFYGRGRLRVKGFARWDQPEIFDLHGYAKIWSDPRLLANTLASVDRERVRGVKELVLVYGGRGGARPTDAGRVHYGTARLLRTELLRRYRVVSVEQFDGIEESFTAYHLRLQAVVGQRFTPRGRPRRLGS